MSKFDCQMRQDPLLFSKAYRVAVCLLASYSIDSGDKELDCEADLFYLSSA